MKFGGKGRKFRARWTKSSDGSNHPSAGEAMWWDRMLLLQRAKQIFNLVGEPRFDIYIAKDCPHCRDHGEYVGFVKLDAEFDDDDGVHRYQDFKGVEGETPLSKFKRRVVEARYGVSVEVVGPAVKRAAEIKRKNAAGKLRLGDDREP